MFPFYNNSWIHRLISSFAIMEHWYIIPLGRGDLRVKSIEWSIWKCKGICLGEEKIPMYSSMILSTCFYCVVEPFLGAMDVAMIFSLIWEWIKNKTNFLVWEMILLNCLAEIKEMVVGWATSSVLYNLSPKVIIIVWGLDSYITWHFYKYGFPNNTSQMLRGATSHNTSYVKGLML